MKNENIVNNINRSLSGNDIYNTNGNSKKGLNYQLHNSNTNTNKFGMKNNMNIDSTGLNNLRGKNIG